LAKHGIPLQAHSPAVGMSLADGVYAIMQWSTWKNSFVRCRLEGGRGRPGDAAGLGEDEMDEAGVSDDVTEVTGETDETDESDQAVSDGPLPAPRPGRAASHGQICAAEREAYQRGQRASTSLGTPGMSAGAFLRSPYAIGGEPDVQLTIHPWDKCAAAQAGGGSGRCPSGGRVQGDQATHGLRRLAPPDALPPMPCPPSAGTVDFSLRRERVQACSLGGGGRAPARELTSTHDHTPSPATDPSFRPSPSGILALGA
jgi:hypothetical protein